MPLCFEQLRDGSIRIHTDKGTYEMTPNGFGELFGTGVPVLPPGIHERHYYPGIRHPFITNGDVVDGGSREWSFGDDILARVDDLMAKRKEQEEAAQEEARAKAETQIEEEAKAAEASREQAAAEFAEREQQEKERVAAFVEKRNAALDKFAEVLQNMGASSEDIQLIIDGIWPNRK